MSLPLSSSTAIFFFFACVLIIQLVQTSHTQRSCPIPWNLDRRVGVTEVFLGWTKVHSRQVENIFRALCLYFLLNKVVYFSPLVLSNGGSEPGLNVDMYRFIRVYWVREKGFDVLQHENSTVIGVELLRNFGHTPRHSVSVKDSIGFLFCLVGKNCKKG